MSLCGVLFTIMIITHRCSALWMEGSSPLPRADGRLAVGYDTTTDTILLFGGYFHGRQFVKFKDHLFTDEGQNYLNGSQTISRAIAQQYTQIGHDLWIIRADEEGFVLIDTQTFAASTPPITFPRSIGGGTCLTSMYGFLIVVGGNFVQIYDINNDRWLSDVPSLSKSQTAGACAVVNEKVYVIGGKDSSSVKLKSIQELDVSNLPTTTDLSWNDFPGSLGTARFGLRAAVRGTDIYVIGGILTNDMRSQAVDIIDTLNGECHIGDSLAFETVYAPSIIANDVLYTFGGTNNNAVVRNKYQYTVLPTAAPTNDPTAEPSIASIEPSIAPTKEPTVASVSPTSQTEEPTNDPSTTPSSAPTNPPSAVPSASTSPTKADKTPTLVAADNPSKHTTEGSESESTIAITRMDDWKTTLIGNEREKTSVDVMLIVMIAICIVTFVAIVVFGRALLGMIKESKTSKENICSEVAESNDAAQSPTNQVLAAIDGNNVVTAPQIQTHVNKDIAVDGLEIIEDITSGYTQNDIVNDVESMDDEGIRITSVFSPNDVMNDMEVIGDDDIANDTTMGGDTLCAS